MGRKTKAQIIAEKADEKSNIEKERIIKLLVDSSQYHQALDPLIEVYIEAYEIHYTMYEQWKLTGFRPTQRYKNKSGAINEIKHPLAQQVDVWNQRKAKYLNQLGLDNKNKDLIINGGVKLSGKDEDAQQNKQEEAPENELVKFRRRFN